MNNAGKKSPMMIYTLTINNGFEMVALTYAYACYLDFSPRFKKCQFIRTKIRVVSWLYRNHSEVVWKPLLYLKRLTGLYNL